MHASRTWRPTLSLLAVLTVAAGLLPFWAVGVAKAETTSTFLITKSADDAEQRPSSTDLTSSDLELVTDGSYAQTVGLRFSGVAIPQGATVTDAYVQFTTDESSSAATALKVHGVDSSDPGSFTTSSTSISGRARTDANVAWNPPSWDSVGTAGTRQRTPNLAPVVQEIVDRSTWAGNGLGLLISGTGKRTAVAYDQSASKAPKLTVTWTTGTTQPPANQAPTVSAGPDRAVTLPATASLDGTVTDDGLPTGSTVAQTWTKVSGPGTVTFASPNATDTTASFSATGAYVLRLTGTDGTLSASDDVQVTVSETPTTPTNPAAQRAPGAPACPTNVVRPFPPGTTINQQWSVSAPPDNITYDLTGVTSTAYPNGSQTPFSLGGSSESNNICVNGGRLDGTTDDAQSWEYYHDQQNASCIRIVATGFAQSNGLRCNDVEDGLKVLEDADKATNLNVTTWYSSGVWLDRVRDDCMENDYTVGGVLHDSLWERCNTGLSERPSSSNGTWTSPSSETIVLDHMLIGLWKTWHEQDAKFGHNAIFKWSTSANKPVIKCSTFYVPEKSLNGSDSMAIPAGTTIDDSACPNDPTTIVWGGGGSYPGDLRGLPIRVISDKSYWDGKVANWKATHAGS